MARTNSKARGPVAGGLLAGDTADHIALEVRQEVGLARRVQLDVMEASDADTH